MTELFGGVYAINAPAAERVDGVQSYRPVDRSWDPTWQVLHLLER